MRSGQRPEKGKPFLGPEGGEGASCGPSALCSLPSPLPGSSSPSLRVIVLLPPTQRRLPPGPTAASRRGQWRGRVEGVWRTRWWWSPEPVRKAENRSLGDAAAPEYVLQPGFEPRTPGSTRCVWAAPAHCCPKASGSSTLGVFRLKAGRQLAIPTGSLPVGLGLGSRPGGLQSCSPSTGRT